MNNLIVNQLKEIIAEQLDVNIKREDIADDAALLEEGLGLDSIVVMELITLIEENFNFHFDDNDLSMDHFQNMQTLSQLIASKQERQAA